MAQAWTETEEKLLKEDPLHDVKEEIQHGSPRLKHVDLPVGDVFGDDVRMEDIVKGHVPEAFLDELKNDHGLDSPLQDLGGSEAEFMADDPLHNVKQELEHHSPHLRHVDSPYSPGHHPSPPAAGGVTKSEVPLAFEEELKNDHNIVTGNEDASVVATEGGLYSPGGGRQAVHNEEFVSNNVLSPLLLRGRPMFRMSANVGNRPYVPPMTPETANMCVKDPADDDEESWASFGGNPPESSDEVVGTKQFSLRGGIPARGTPHFRISANHGMRPGGPLSRDLTSEIAPNESTVAGGEGATDLSAEMKPKGPGLPSRGGFSNAGPPRRGGLARTGSGVPGDQRGGGGGSLARTGSGVPGSLARTGSGVPGSLARTGSGVPGSLARTGSGVPGNSLARQGSGAFGGGLGRTGSGIPSAKGGSDLTDFSAFLDSPDFEKEEIKSPASEATSGDV